MRVWGLKIKTGVRLQKRNCGLHHQELISQKRAFLKMEKKITT